ncbi:unnamed protein product [Rhizophagus irregularis]|nr:unnamed protein product [Rhizophagus irregularis]
MDITVLASGSSSKYLEPLYGYVTIPRWYENSTNIFELILTVGKGNEDEGSEDKSNHFKIYLYGFNVLSLVLDILFAKVEAGSVKIIFFVSVFFVTVPYVIKLGYVVYIILSELVREEKSDDSVQLLEEKDDPDDLNGQQDDSQSQQDGTQGQQQQVIAKEKLLGFTF